MILTWFEIVDVYDIFFSFSIAKKNNEWYRVLTANLFFGGFKLQTISMMFAFGQFSSMVESSIMSNHPFDFIIMILFGMSMNILSSPLTNDMLFGPTLTAFMFYYWSKHYSDQSMNVMGLPINVKAIYVPFIYLLLALYEGGIRNAMAEIVGLLIGHLYYYLHDILDLRFGIKVLRTPDSIKNIIKYFVQ